VGPLTIALAILTALLALIPARRLALAGIAPRAIGTYVLVVWVLAMLIALLRGPASFLVPFLLVLYLAPFVTLRAGIDALRVRLGPPRDPDRPIRDVTPRDDHRTGEPGSDGPRGREP
jgi:hypothetical protein